MQKETLGTAGVDELLLSRFRREIGRHVPHWDNHSSTTIKNPTPLVDITLDLIECARVEYGLDISTKGARVLGKFESRILGGSVKVRPTLLIIENAISSGALTRHKTIFEATSGNFGLALGLVGKRLGLKVVVLVSRKLQEGVLDELKKEGVNAADLDVDVCPAPGLKVDQNMAVAKVVASRLRDQLVQFDLDGRVFDNSRVEIEKLLAKQDAINLAKFLAKIYDGFCPEQYDNESNVKVHETVTGPEIGQQLKALGDSLADYGVVCTFGTGGTSGGLSRYIYKEFGKKSVRVVFPLGTQDVGGIRTKEKASGLKFYETDKYAGLHEADFDSARRTLRFFVKKKGYDIGESSALALYATIQMMNYGVGEKFVVILADGIEKYRKSLEETKEKGSIIEVTVEEARSNVGKYGSVLWAHPEYTPNREGLKLISSALGIDETSIDVAKPSDVERFFHVANEPPDGLRHLLERNNGTSEKKFLIVCMSGINSLKVAKLLTGKGIGAVSLTGGITGLSMSAGKEISELVQIPQE